MTVPTPIQQRIRILDARGVSWRRISKEVGVSRQTVRKYAQLEDCSPEPPARPAAVSKLDPYKPLIGKWLEADRFMPRKQRHTARRVYDRLVEEQGFDGSYQIVQRYVKRWRQEHRLPGDGYPGVGVVAGRDCGRILVWRRPWWRGAGRTCTAWSSRSRIRTCGTRWRCPGRTRSACAVGLLGVFEHIGAVPPVLVPGRRHRRGAPGLVGQDRGGGGVPEVRRASPDRGRVSAIRARATRRAARGGTRSGSCAAT